MRAHILSTSPEIGGMLRAGLEVEGGQHHVTIDAEVATLERPIPMDVDLLIADLDNPCISPTKLVRHLEAHPARQHARVILLCSTCTTARRLQHRYLWATVVHSLRDVLRVHDLWLEVLRGRGTGETPGSTDHSGDGAIDGKRRQAAAAPADQPTCSGILRVGTTRATLVTFVTGAPWPLGDRRNGRDKATRRGKISRRQLVLAGLALGGSIGLAACASSNNGTSPQTRLAASGAPPTTTAASPSTVASGTRTSQVTTSAVVKGQAAVKDALNNAAALDDQVLAKETK